MASSMKKFPYNKPVQPKQQKKVLKGLWERHGRSCVQFPKLRAEDTPLTYFSSLQGHNPDRLISEASDEADDSSEPEDEIQDDAESVERFYELQAILNKTAASPRAIGEARNALGLSTDPGRWLLGGLRVLKPHQVLSVGWALAMITKLGFAYISSDVGLGKTKVAAALIEQIAANAQAPQLPEENLHIYKPTLVLVPRNGVMGWFDEFETFPGITAHQWYGNPNDALARRSIGPSFDRLILFLDRLDQHDPATAHKVIVTTYTKYRDETMERREGTASNAEIDADETLTKKQKDQKKLDRYESRLQGRFGLIILDEAHKAKNVVTKTHTSISRTRADKILGLTSTPILQTPRDLHGLIELAWHTAVARVLVADMEVHESRKFYGELAEELPSSVAADPKFLPLLHPASFKRYLGYSTADDKLVRTAQNSLRVVRPIMRFCFLRFYKGQSLSPFGLDEVVGGDIKPYKPLVVELRFKQRQQKVHDRSFEKIAAKLHSGSNDESEPGFYECGQLNGLAHKELVQLASNAYSGKVMDKMGSKSANTVHEMMTRPDSGFTFLFKSITSGEDIPILPVPDSGKERAQFICSLHPKWAYLAGILQEVSLL